MENFTKQAYFDFKLIEFGNGARQWVGWDLGNGNDTGDLKVHRQYSIYQ